MDPGASLLLRGHLADFETTTSELLRPQEARTILNFAALFHEVIYLADTALGDHKLIIKSFERDGELGLFGHVSSLIRAGILKVLCRDRVVVRDKVLVAQHPTIADIYDGWRYRDSTEWGGDSGFTTLVEDRVRSAYNREVDKLLSQYEAIERYDADIPKVAFRERVRDLLNREAPSTLSQSLAQLPVELQRLYFDATKDDRFTNAELWRVLRRAPAGGATEPIILHAHINQQCFADLTGAGQSGHDRGVNSLASFNLELQRRRPLSLEIEATIHPPASLDELLERAAVRLPAVAIELFDQLPVEKIISLRRRAGVVFELARTPVAPKDVEWMRDKYLKALETYWGYIVQALQETHPARVLQPTRAGLFVERELPSLGRLYKQFGKSIFGVLLRLGLASAPAPAQVSAPLASDVVHRLGVVLLQERTSQFQELTRAVPPPSWYPRAFFALDAPAPKTRGL